MKVEIKRLSPEEWKKLAFDAHKTVFGEIREAEKDKIDFVLFATDKSNTPVGYITVKHMDDESVYWQFGGSFPTYRGTSTTYRSYEMSVNWVQQRGYKRILTYIENTNIPMLKMAMKVGFKIIGIKVFKEHVLLEHILEF